MKLVAAPAPEPARPLKRKREEGAPKPIASTLSDAPKRKTYISSLFSSLPVQAAVEPVDEIDQSSLKPSNAPSDGSFASLGLSIALNDALRGPKLGLERPTPIQLAALPSLLKPDVGRDAILQAQTGSGKTIAYLLPVLQDLLNLATELKTSPDRSVGTLAIVLVPTRELANQVYEVATSLLAFKAAEGQPSQKWLTPGLLSGGMQRQHEKARLRKGIPLLIATVRKISTPLPDERSPDDCSIICRPPRASDWRASRYGSRRSQSEGRLTKRSRMRSSKSKTSRLCDLMTSSHHLKRSLTPLIRDPIALAPRSRLLRILDSVYDGSCSMRRIG